MAQLHPVRILAAIISTFALISIIPLCLLLIMTSVAALPTEDPTPNLVGRLQTEDPSKWNTTSLCSPHKGQCQLGTYTTAGNKKTAALTLFDPKCIIIGSNDQASRKSKFAFDSELSYVVDVEWDDFGGWTAYPNIGYKGELWVSDDENNWGKGWFGPNDLNEYFFLLGFNC